MLHIITAYVLAIILLANHINTLVIVSDFVINQDFIAKTLCIQKDDQQGCNGKCQLKTELAKNETGPDSNTPRNQAVKRIGLDFYFVSEISKLPSGNENFIVTNVTNYTFIHTLKSQSIPVDTPPPDFS
ncbi:hypothetical protein ACFSQP_02090 [Bizionia sediminis]|uniref:Uncharacterized protein n=1 Tax=Bizionia sediminis TaxID=1737064 RepID=A0ABW5KP50_9FLAO